jgi:hypothetical protein
VCCESKHKHKAITTDDAYTFTQHRVDEVMAEGVADDVDEDDLDAADAFEHKHNFRYGTTKDEVLCLVHHED